MSWIYQRLGSRKSLLIPGMVLRFSQPIEFVSGDKLDTFIFIGCNTFVVEGVRYQIPQWRERDFKVVGWTDAA